MRRLVEIVLLRGKVVSPETPIVPGNALGLLRGEGVFESFLVSNGTPPSNLSRHAERLRTSADLLHLSGEVPNLESAFAEIQPHVMEGDWRVRFSLYRLDKENLLPVWTAGHAAPPPQEVDLFLSTLCRDPMNPLAQAKTISRAAEQWAARAAQERGAFDALLPSTNGELAECTSANLLFWDGSTLCTPSLDCGILGGTTRADLLERCLRVGIPYQEGHFPLDSLKKAEELFVTNAVIGVIPVRRVLGLGQEFPGAGGPFLQTLRGAYLGRKVSPS